MVSQFVTIDILGKSYTLQTDADESRVSQVVEILKKEIDRVETELTQKDPLQTKDIMVLLLAALNIAGVNHELGARLGMLHQLTQKQISDLKPIVASVKQ